ncbi:MAG: galactose oxidase [Ideonella sp. MAG2]|nr:MAG: galactose oxidase [Ideonella sp. MAG2]
MAIQGQKGAHGQNPFEGGRANGASKTGDSTPPKALAYPGIRLPPGQAGPARWAAEASDALKTLAASSGKRPARCQLCHAPEGVAALKTSAGAVSKRNKALNSRVYCADPRLAVSKPCVRNPCGLCAPRCRHLQGLELYAMNTKMNRWSHGSLLAATCVALLSLTACGGGGGSEAEEPAAALDPDLRRAPTAARSPLNAQTAATARWSAPTSLSLVPSSGSVLPNGKVLLWSADTPMGFGGSGRTYTTLFDPATNSASDRLVQETGHAMFCTGTTLLPDGRLLVNGGSDSAATSIYDLSSNSWTRGGNMNIPRGYQSNTLLQDGSVLTFGGSWSGGTGNKHGEVWSSGSGWRNLSGLRIDSTLTPDGPWGGDSHYWLVPAGNGKVLHPGPGVRMHWLDTSGSGAITYIGDRTDPSVQNGADGPSVAGSFVMYDVGRGLKTGGVHKLGQAARSNAYVIEFDKGVSVRKVADMAFQRVYQNSVVLPDGRVVLIGGQTFEAQFTDRDSVMSAEIWDPTTETFTTLPAAMSVPRNYHSIAMLMPDGRVMAAGGGLCGGCSANHADLQMLSPPYLFNADGSPAQRPVINTAPSTVRYGSVVNVAMSGPVTDFALVRMSSTTHTINNDQRRIPLLSADIGNNIYSLQIPSNPGWLLPGVWMLFAMDAKGVPSVAKLVSISADGLPLIQPVPSHHHL